MPEQTDEVTDVNDYFKQYKDFLLCRKLGHAFRPTHNGYFLERGSGLLYQRLQCIGGCGMTAVDTFHPKTLERVGNRAIGYSDKPGYLAKGTHISRQDARMWEVKNVKPKVEPKTGAGGGTRKRTA